MNRASEQGSVCSVGLHIIIKLELVSFSSLTARQHNPKKKCHPLSTRQNEIDHTCVSPATGRRTLQLPAGPGHSFPAQAQLRDSEHFRLAFIKTSFSDAFQR